MKQFLFIFFLFFSSLVYGQLGVKYDPSVQSTGNLQYWRPKGNLFVGDCMPYYRDGKFSFYWLLDSAHHASLKGLGGHQWALSTTHDLKTWKQEPVVIGIDEDWEKSICTGSIAFYRGTYYAFYATRLIDQNGKVNEQLSYATSKDGIRFDKQKPNPFYTSANGYSKRDFRDPKIFIGEKTGEFHLFVSSWQEDPVLKHAGGSLVHLVSKDLKQWDLKEPVLTGQPSVPECPDYFFWKGWYYLVYGHNGDTYYVKSKNPYGPWEEPKFQALNESWSNVLKTAGFKNDRRISASWVPSRRDNKDNGEEMFGGNALFREVTQLSDGTLETSFPLEMIPPHEAPLETVFVKDSFSKTDTRNDLTIAAPNGIGAAHIENIPLNARITMEIEPLGTNEEFGFYLRSDANATNGYRTSFSAINQTVQLGNTDIKAVAGLDKAIRIDLIMTDGIIDLCIDGRRCVVNRSPEQKGSLLWFFAKHGTVKFKSVKISPLIIKKEK